jgi:hypothetical protein
MTAGPWTLVSAFRTNLVTGALGNLTASNALNCALVTSSSNVGAASTTYSALTGEVASGNGYTTGGVTGITLTDSGTTSVTLTPSANIVWTATSSGITADYAVLYLASSGDIIAYCQLTSGSGTTSVTAGNTLTISDSNPVLTVA